MTYLPPDSGLVRCFTSLALSKQCFGIRKIQIQPPYFFSRRQFSMKSPDGSELIEDVSDLKKKKRKLERRKNQNVVKINDTKMQAWVTNHKMSHFRVLSRRSRQKTSLTDWTLFPFLCIFWMKLYWWKRFLFPDSALAYKSLQRADGLYNCALTVDASAIYCD